MTKSSPELWRYRPGVRVVGTHYNPPRHGTVVDEPNADNRASVVWDNDGPRCPDIVHIMHLELASTEEET